MKHHFALFANKLSLQLDGDWIQCYKDCNDPILHQHSVRVTLINSNFWDVGYHGIMLRQVESLRR